MAMAFAVVAAVAVVINAVLTGMGFVVLGDLGSLDTTKNLLISAAWLGAVAGIAALVGVASVVWTLVLRRTWVELVEVAVATVATLLIAIGLLIAAVVAPMPLAARLSNSTSSIVLDRLPSGWPHHPPSCSQQLEPAFKTDRSMTRDWESLPGSS
jgi:membrane-associated phospholipid phosphatase